jgi:hypothetical protein
MRWAIDWPLGLSVCYAASFGCMQRRASSECVLPLVELAAPGTSRWRCWFCRLTMDAATTAAAAADDATCAIGDREIADETSVSGCSA